MRLFAALLLTLLSFCVAAQIVINPYSIAIDADPTPSQLFADDLKFYLDTEDPYDVTLTGSNNNHIMTMTSSDESHVVVSSLSSQRTIWNGHSMYTRGNTYMQVGTSTGLYNFLHTGGQFTVAFRLYVDNLVTGTGPLLNNNNNASTSRGIYAYYAAATDNVAFRIFNGTSGQICEALSPSGSVTKGAWHDIIVTYTSGKVLTVYVDGVAGTPVTNSFAHGVGDAVGNMTMFRLSGSGTYANDLLIKRPMFINRVATSEEMTGIRTILAGTKDFGGAGIANVYGMYGQSNMSGRASDYAGTPAYFDDPTGCFMYNITDGLADEITNTWAAHQLGVNASTEGQSNAGPDIEFGYRMNLLSPGTIYLLKYAVSASSMEVAAEPIKDWNYTSSTNDCASRAFDVQLIHALKELKYQLNKEVVFRGFLWRQGEGDIGYANYGSDLLNLLTLRFKAKLESLGYSAAKCRFVAASQDGLEFSHANITASVVAYTQDVADNIQSSGFAGGYQFSTIGFGVQGDGTHLNLSGQIAQGFAFYDYLRAYLYE